MEERQQDEAGFFQRHRIAVVVGVVVLLGGLAYHVFGGKTETKRKVPMSVVSIVPPPPPPSPTPPPTPPPEPPPDTPKQPEFQPEEQPKVAPEPPPPEPPAAPLGTSIQGDG